MDEKGFRDAWKRELIGLHAKVADAQNRDYHGIEGKIIDETKNTLVIRCSDRTKVVQKIGTAFIVNMGGRKVRIDGKAVAKRPEERIIVK